MQSKGMPSTCSSPGRYVVDESQSYSEAPMWQQAGVALDICVRFAETDLMGIAHHSAYVVWFEAGRVAWMEAAGMPYAEIAATGHHFAVTALEAEYRSAARFGDTVCVTTYLEEIRSRRVQFRYEVTHCQDGTLLATGCSGHICVDLQGRMATIPATVVKRLKQGGEALAHGENDN